MEEKEVQYITPEKQPQPVYFKSLTIENVKCFQGEHFIDLSNGKGGPAQWTVILGNNNTGKTTLLKCLAAMEPEFQRFPHDGKHYFDPQIGAKYHPTISFFYEIPPGQSIVVKSRLAKVKKPDANYSVFSKTPTGALGTLDWELSMERELHLIKIHDLSLRPEKEIEEFKIFNYGTSRGDLNSDNFDQTSNIIKAEDWLFTLKVAVELGQEVAEPNLNLAKKVLTSGILPDVIDIEFKSEAKGTSFENFVLFQTDYGAIRLRELGYGYQTMIAWVLDLVRRMVERYPDSPNPLAEPAIVLVDEIDLHLHPDWQRKIIAHLTRYFPNTQFIVTAHSPLIVQSAEEVNLVILKKENGRVVVDQPNIRSFKGWTVEEILTDLMQLEGQTMSNTYLDLMAQFDKALDEDDYEKAQSAYNQLDAILHPQSSQRKLLKLQMSALSQTNAV